MLVPNTWPPMCPKKRDFATFLGYSRNMQKSSYENATEQFYREIQVWAHLRFLLYEQAMILYEQGHDLFEKNTVANSIKKCCFQEQSTNNRGRIGNIDFRSAIIWHHLQRNL